MSERRKLYPLMDALEKNGGPLPLSVPGIYKAVAEGKIPCVSIGKRKFIPGWYIDALVAPPQEAGQV